MQALAWLGFALGMALLLVTGSSVIKTLLIPRNLSSAIGTAVSRSVRAVYRYPEQAWPLALLAVLDAAALHLSLNPESAPAEIRPLLRMPG
jgi:hypothetical protein